MLCISLRLSTVQACLCSLQVYSQDPVIVAWNLINEPRCDAVGCNVNIQSWVEEMAPYLKSVDPNHLVTIGGWPALSFWPAL